MTEASLASDVDLGNKGEQNAPAEDPRNVVEHKRVEGDGQENKFERPEGFPEDLWDSEANDVKKTALIDAYQKESKRTQDLRNIIAKGGQKAPESVDEYQIEFGDEVKDLIQENDPALDVFKAAAHKNGLSQEQFKGVMNDYLAGLKEGELLAPGEPPKTEEQLAEEDKKFVEGEKAKLGEEGMKIFDNLNHSFAAAYKNGSLNDEDKEAYMNAVYNAEGVQFVDKLVNLARMGKFGMGESIPTKEMLGEGMLTKEQLDAMGADPRMKTDPEFRKRRSDGYAALEKRGFI